MPSVHMLSPVLNKAQDSKTPRVGALMIPAPSVVKVVDPGNPAADSDSRFKNLLETLSNHSAKRGGETDKASPTVKERARAKRSEREDSPANADERTETPRVKDEPNSVAKNETTVVRESGRAEETPQDARPAEAADENQTGEMDIAKDATSASQDKDVQSSDSVDVTVQTTEDAATEIETDPSAQQNSESLLRQLAAQSVLSPAATSATASQEAEASRKDAEVSAPVNLPSTAKGTSEPAGQRQGSDSPARTDTQQTSKDDVPVVTLDAGRSEDASREAKNDKRPQSFDKLVAHLRGMKATVHVQTQSSSTASSTAPAIAEELANLLATAGGIANSSAARSETQAGSPTSGAVNAVGADKAGVAHMAPQLQAMRESDAGTERAGGFRETLAQQRANTGNPTGNIEKAAEMIRSNVGLRNSSMTIRLDPPELGSMKLDAQLRNDVLTVKIQASSEAAKSMLESRVNELRIALERHGITIDRIDIEVRPQTGSQSSQNDEQRYQNNQNPSHQQTTDGGVQEQWQHKGASSSHGGQGDATFARKADQPDESEIPSGTAEDAMHEAASATESSVNVMA